MRPAAPPRNAHLSKKFLETLQTLFPQLHQDRSSAQQSQIASAIGQIALQQSDHYELIHREKVEKETSTVAPWPGEDQFLALLNVTGCRNEADLTAACLVWLAMAKVGKAQKMARYQVALDNVLADRELDDPVVLCTPSMFINLLSCKWNMITPD